MSSAEGPFQVAGFLEVDVGKGGTVFLFVRLALRAPTSLNRETVLYLVEKLVNCAYSVLKMLASLSVSQL